MANSSSKPIKLEIVTPDRGVVREEVEEISTPGKEGYLGILPGHAPLLSELQPGELTYKKSGQNHYLAINGGFAEVLPYRVIILTHAAELSNEVDRERAEKARERAEKRLARFNDSTVNFQRARAALARAVTRLRISDRIP